VGYDGIPEVIDLMNTRDERFLIATIDVKIQEQAEHAWRLMKAHLSPRRGIRHDSPLVKIVPSVVERGHLRGGDFASEFLKQSELLCEM
jgi:hypothetical protein